MGSKKSDSSFVTKILLNNNEETFSENPKFKPKENHHNNTCKTHSETTMLKTTSTKSHITPDIHISQHIQVENKDFQCVINLNTNVYEHISRSREKSIRKHRSRREKRESKPNVRTTSRGDKDRYYKSRRSINNSRCKDQEAPSCNRRSCWNLYERQQERFRRQGVFTDAHVLRENYHRNEKKVETSLTKDIIMEQDLPQTTKKKTQVKPTRSRVLLSPISSSSLLGADTKHDITYEDISSGSLDITRYDTRVLRTYKHHRKHSKHYKHRHKHTCSKLDTLIKRTKERERKMVEKSRNWFTSSPIPQEHSSADFPVTCNDMDISNNSISTILIESPPHYSYFQNENLHAGSHSEKHGPTVTCKDMDISINSISTILLGSLPHYSCFQSENLHAGSHSEKHSTTKEFTFQNENSRASCETLKLSNYEPYSPSSTIKELFTPIKDTIDFKCLNEEPKIKVEVYSPTVCPESTPKILYEFTDVKQEVEIKPWYPDLSQVYKN